MDRGSYVSPTRLTVREYLEERWLPAITMTVRPSTHASYARNIRLHVIPRLGAVPLQKLDPMMLDDVDLHLLTDGRVDGKGGLSIRSVRYLHFVLHRALRDAMRWQLLTRNVTEAADPPKERAHLRPEIQTSAPETLRAFLDGTRGDRRHVAWLLLASTGMRRGEVLGLRWADVDLRAGQLAIRQTLVTADMVTLFGEPNPVAAGALWRSTARRSTPCNDTAGELPVDVEPPAPACTRRLGSTGRTCAMRLTAGTRDARLPRSVGSRRAT